MKITRVLRASDIKKILLKYFGVRDGEISVQWDFTTRQGEMEAEDAVNRLEVIVSSEETPARNFEF